MFAPLVSLGTAVVGICVRYLVGGDIFVAVVLAMCSVHPLSLYREVSRGDTSEMSFWFMQPRHHFRSADMRVFHAS